MFTKCFQFLPQKQTFLSRPPISRTTKVFDIPFGLKHCHNVLPNWSPPKTTHGWYKMIHYRVLKKQKRLREPNRTLAQESFFSVFEIFLLTRNIELFQKFSWDIATNFWGTIAWLLLNYQKQNKASSLMLMCGEKCFCNFFSKRVADSNHLLASSKSLSTYCWSWQRSRCGRVRSHCWWSIF